MLSYECLMYMPIDYLNFMSYTSYKTSYRYILRKWSILLPKIKIPLALSIKNWGNQLKKAWRGWWNGNVRKKEKSEALIALTRQLIRWGPVSRFVRNENFKSLLRFIFYIVSSILQAILLVLASRDWFQCGLDRLTWFWKRFKGFEGSSVHHNQFWHRSLSISIC